MKTGLKKSQLKNVFWAMISAVLAFLTIKVVLDQNKDMSVGELWKMVKASDKLFVVLAVIAAAMFVWFEGVAILSILKRSGYKRSHFQGLLYSTSDIYFSAITPSATGGQPASAYFMMRDGIPGGIITATLILNLAMYTASIIFLGVVSIIFRPMTFLGFNTFSRVIIVLGFVALLTLATIFIVLLKKENLIFTPAERLINFLHKKKIIKNKDAKLKKLEKHKEDYTCCADLISSSKRVMTAAFIWNLIQRSSQIMVPVLIYKALGGDAQNMIDVFCKQVLITIGYNFVPIPGGMGISDYLMIDGFGELMGSDLSYNVELISRVISFYMCVLISGLITLAGYFIGRKKDDRRL